jgi:hypothetical protein
VTPFFSNKRFLKKDSFVDLALGNIALKAWDARQAASPQVLPVPRFISQCRNKRAEKQLSEGTLPTPNDVSPMEGNSPDFGSQFVPQYPMLDQNSFNIDAGFGQAVMPEMFPVNNAPPVWGFWNNMMQVGGPMQMDTTTPPYDFYQN